MPMQADASCPAASESSMPSVLHNTLEDYAKRLQLQYDWTDALTSYQIGTRSEDNRLRTRHQERVSSSWQVRINIQDLHAALRYESNRIAHNINRIVARSRMTPLSLPTEHISFPFHSFWYLSNLYPIGAAVQYPIGGTPSDNYKFNYQNIKQL